MTEAATLQARDVLRRKGSALRMVLYFLFVPMFLARGVIFGRTAAYAMAALLLALGIWFALRLRKADRGSIAGPMIADMVTIFLGFWEADLAPYSAVPFIAALLVSAFTLAPAREANRLLVPAGLIWLALSVRRTFDYGLSPTTVIETLVSALGMLAIFRYLPVAAAGIAAAMDEKDQRLAESAANAEMQHRFTSMVSHELRSPLTAITGFAEVLLDPEVELGEADRTEFLSMIHSQSVEMDRLLEDILVALRLDAGKLVFETAVIPVGKKVKEVISAIPEVRGRTIMSDVPVGLAALGDPMRVGQILRNLIGNAGKHGGPNIKISAVRQNGRVVLAVEDDGAGLAPEAVARLFADFEQGTGDSRKLGYGLGLGISRRLVEGMGGELWYEAPGQGARFCVGLPAA